MNFTSAFLGANINNIQTHMRAQRERWRGCKGRSETEKKKGRWAKRRQEEEEDERKASRRERKEMPVKSKVTDELRVCRFLCLTDQHTHKSFLNLPTHTHTNTRNPGLF